MKTIKIYSVLFEDEYENCDIHSSIVNFSVRDDAVKCLEVLLKTEILDEYTEEEVKSRLVRDGDDYFCFYHDEAQSNWKFRCTIYEDDVEI